MPFQFSTYIYFSWRVNKDITCVLVTLVSFSSDVLSKEDKYSCKRKASLIFCVPNSFSRLWSTRTYSWRYQLNVSHNENIHYFYWSRKIDWISKTLGKNPSNIFSGSLMFRVEICPSQLSFFFFGSVKIKYRSIYYWRSMLAVCLN